MTRYARIAIDRLAPLRRLVKSPPLQHLIQSVRAARAVGRTVAFAGRQFGPARLHGYRLRDSGHAVFVRHRTRDVHILNEIFGGTGGRRCYEPPNGFAEALDRAPAPRVLDLGGNIGLFGAYALGRWPSATIRSFEPDPENAGILERTIEANDQQQRWTMVQAAVADRAGCVAFASGLYADSHVRTQPNVPLGGGMIRVPTVDLFAHNGHCDLLKIDIEGGEWPILADPRLREFDADVIVLEWHDRDCPEGDPRGCALRLLRRAGYSDVCETDLGERNGMLWARRPEGCVAPARWSDA